MSLFTYINLGDLPPAPTYSLPYETIRAEIIAEYQQHYPDAELTDADPAIKVIDTVAYRELMLRQRIDEGINTALLASESAYLDHIGRRFGVERQLISPGDDSVIPAVLPVFESDDRYRQRIQLALEGFSTAGSTGGYVFHALAASPEVKDVYVDTPVFSIANLDAELAAQLPPNTMVLQCTDDVGLDSPLPGDVAISILSKSGNGSPSESLKNTVLSHLSADDIRPLTDRVRIKDVEIVEYTVDAALTLYHGPDATSVVDAATQAVTQYVNTNHALGRDITLSGLYAALHQPGVQDVTLTSPAANIARAGQQAAFCTSVNVVNGGRND